MKQKFIVTVKHKLDAGSGQYGTQNKMVVFEDALGNDFYWHTTNVSKAFQELEENKKYRISATIDKVSLSYVKILEHL